LILKPIDSYRFVLAVRQDYFDSNSYRDLVDGDYNSSTMNQFATDQDTGFNLLTYMATTPVGHQETSLTYSGRPWKLFGWNIIKEVTHACDNEIQQHCTCKTVSSQHSILFIPHGQIRVQDFVVDGTCVD
jgi:hypothetical protein